MEEKEIEPQMTQMKRMKRRKISSGTLTY
jgi:hypothetical protein